MPPRVSVITTAKTQVGFGEGTSGKYRDSRGAVKAQAKANAGGAVTNQSDPWVEAL
ncbi:hypothetical protein DFH27DRAFT_613517 [Peziza echinospora]|nr:hypothetical protein DFH27DRAFT_613517 [Peziza echinospora]